MWANRRYSDSALNVKEFEAILDEQANEYKCKISDSNEKAEFESLYSVFKLKLLKKYNTAST